MIIRIVCEGQYRLPGTAAKRLTELDAHVLDALERGDEQRFHAAFTELLTFIERTGSRLSDYELAVSNLVVPHRDTTLAEAQDAFAGEIVG